MINLDPKGVEAWRCAERGRIETPSKYPYEHLADLAQSLLGQLMESEHLRYHSVYVDEQGAVKCRELCVC